MMMSRTPATAARRVQRSSAPTQSSTSTRSQQESARTRTASSPFRLDRFQIGGRNLGIGVQQPARTDPASATAGPMTGQKADALIQQGMRNGTLTAANSIRSHFAANSIMGLSPWQRPGGDAKTVTAEQLQRGLAQTAGTRTADQAAPKVSPEQMQSALDYVNGARDASDQRQRISKSLQGLFVDSQGSPAGRGTEKGGPPPPAEPIGRFPLRKALHVAGSKPTRGLFGGNQINTGSGSGSGTTPTPPTENGGIIVTPNRPLV